MSNKIVTKSITEVSQLILGKKISPVELTKAVINQTETYNREINSYIYFSKEKALNTAYNAAK